MQCFAFEVLHQSTAVVGRATHVFKVLLLGDKDDGSDDQICILKDAWQQCIREDEGYYYGLLKKKMKDPVVRERLKNSVLRLDLDQPDTVPPGLVTHVSTWNMSQLGDLLAASFGFTTSRRPATKLRNAMRDRIRTLMKNIGRPLGSFKSTKELIMCAKDIVKGDVYKVHHEIRC